MVKAALGRWWSGARCAGAQQPRFQGILRQQFVERDRVLGKPHDPGAQVQNSKGAQRSPRNESREVSQVMVWARYIIGGTTQVLPTYMEAVP